MNKLIAIGFTGNYIERDKIRKYYTSLASKHWPVTFFHPLRIIGGSIKEHVEGSERQLVKKLVKLGTLEHDFKNFMRRFRIILSHLPINSHIIVVFHTDYAAPLWCNDEFRSAYINTIPMLLEYINEISYRRNISVKNVIEIHPGFTSIGYCRTRSGRLHCDTVEKDLTKLSKCIHSFKQALLNSVNIEIKFYIEPRAGSIVRTKDRGSEPQTLNTHEDAYIFAKQNKLGLVIDIGQTILKRINIDEAWLDAAKVASIDPAIVKEIHIHSPTSRGRRGHGLPLLEELVKFKELISIILRDRREPLGVVLEVLNASTDKLIQVAEELQKI